MKLSNNKVIETPLGKYFRALETPQHIYFVNYDESDENGAIKMYNRKRELVSDNYFAFEAFTEDLRKANYNWMDAKLKQHLADKKIRKRTKKVLVPLVGEFTRLAYYC